MHSSFLNHYSKVVSMLSFAFVTVLTLISIFRTHAEMPKAFKVAAILLLLLSLCLIRYIATVLHFKGYAWMGYILALHGSLLFVLVLGAREGSYK
ncbi:uncharacterized protein Eint_060525 [Encephalitozoon intestinalis ATCC 50506]|uniref:Uncharacterized protein n=1 Tax=Encephalitozoon intestinalis (strain ATCC 50506) TaxID=876142 RepID=W8P9A0_ENCIT|nr:uncharacterized protein Eint_060525 [Encephalitozoon intestinalis ATCC 50506]AHL30117.1 hypothetical protein Eint_060525 [Encephalitozoon intestinalis ATCC 50506]UTX45397.1 hypothetical protein GPK93_06g09490 [Encephalitozoon intestinalis]